jgi:hypothetical protein
LLIDAEDGDRVRIATGREQPLAAWVEVEAARVAAADWFSFDKR